MLAQLVVSGLAQGVLYALIALSMTMVRIGGGHAPLRDLPPGKAPRRSRGAEWNPSTARPKSRAARGIVRV